MFCSYKQAMLAICLGLIVIVKAQDFDCGDSDSQIQCQGARVLKNVASHIARSAKSDETLKLFDGVEILKSETNEVDGNSERSMNHGVEDKSLVGRVAKYLQTHEMKIRFSDILGKTNFKAAMTEAMKIVESEKDLSEARKKDKGGLGYVLMMGLMMGKMMAALGFGGVGALALKALGVSMMALMLASIIGIKKLSEGGGGGGEHHVQYVSSGDHHRKRREVDEDIPLPYRAYAPEH